MQQDFSRPGEVLDLFDGPLPRPHPRAHCEEEVFALGPAVRSGVDGEHEVVMILD
jgi:hypothetical protein